MAAQQPAATTDAIPGEGAELRRALGPWQLIAIGIGAIIGAGIFVITGQAAADHAGPGIVISFMIACVGCALAGLCYSELAAMIPQSGSAYTYSYAAFGQLVGWIIGWDLCLEYGMAASTVAVGWSGYFNSFLTNQLGVVIPAEFASAPLKYGAAGWEQTGAIVNLPAVGIVAFLTALLIVGIRTSATFNGAMVLLKVAVVLLVIIFGLPLISAENLTPLVPENTTGKFGQFGWDGVIFASGVIFFAYIGFDTVSVAAQEARNPQRDLPIGILGSLAICTVLYILMALTMTGLAHYSTLKVDAPVSVAIQAGGEQLAWLLPLVDIGAITGLSTVILISLYGQTRIFYSMARDGFLPNVFAAVDPKSKTPVTSTLIIGAVVAAFAGLFPLDVLGDLVSVGTLLAFILVCIGVMVLRVTRPNVKRPFKTPLFPFVPIGGVIVCGIMVYPLLTELWLRVVGWLAIGLVIYVVYGMHHAKKPTWTLDDAPTT